MGLYRYIYIIARSIYFYTWKNISNSSLNEDPGDPVLEDEIGALVTLTPIPPSLVSQETNIVSRGGIINDPGELSRATLRKTGQIAEG